MITNAMSSNHFSYFRVKNFKRFKDLEVKDIGQFNLVLGDNNVGKTSLLEAMVFNGALKIRDYASTFQELLIQRRLSIHHEALSRYFVHSENFYSRKKDPIEISYAEGLNADGELKGVEISITDSIKPFTEKNKSRKYGEELELSGIVSPSQNRYDLSTQVPFIPFGLSSDENVADFYMRHLQGNERARDKFLTSLTFLFPDIKNFEPSVLPDDYSDGHKTLFISSKSSDYHIPLGFYGEGTIRAAYILTNIVLHYGSPLMIDEIDTGIHYARMKDYWKVILQSARENDVQLFATTHNRECIQYFIEALDELGDEYQKRARSIRLIEHAQTKEVLSFTSSYSKLMEELATGNEIR